MVPPSTLPSPTLLSRIRDPPPPLSLYHRISPPTEPLSLEETIEICEATLGDGPRAVFHDPPPTPSPPGQRPPTSYVRYEPGDPNHDKYVEQIALDPPYRTPQDPHYVCFDLDFESHQHYVLGLRDDSDPPRQAYGWPLQAAPFIGPKISPSRSDNSALGIFDAGYPGAIEVDIALYKLRDYGVLADVDRYRAHMLEYENLLCQRKVLEDKFFKWHSKSTPLRQRLEKAQARSRLHPYMHLGERISAPFSHRTAPIPEPQTFSMAQCLLIDVESGDNESLRPWFEDRWGVKYTFPDPPLCRCCAYCHAPNHYSASCPRPHSKCHTTIRCLVPRRHATYGGGCHAHHLHLVEVPLPADHNPALEDEGYVGHEDEEGDGES
jgi:hypothetical protein